VTIGEEEAYHRGTASMSTAGAIDANEEFTPGPPARALTVTEPARETPVHAVTDVLVVGGGPARCAAALAARRAGASEVLLVERYNVARDLDNLLAPGRHMAGDPQTQAFMREIPQCWLTGQAAGVAATLAFASGSGVADVDVAALQAELRRQGAYLQSGSGADDSIGAIAGGPPRGPNVSITADTPAL
jgi:hypothetical protein